MTDVRELIERLRFRKEWAFKKSDGNLRYPSGEFIFLETQKANFMYIGDESADAITALTHLSEQNAAKDKEIAELRELMSNLYHAVQHKRDVWETASASQKVFASNDLNVAMANIEISESYKAYCLSLSEGET